MELPPIIAIHGVGTHTPEQIQSGVSAAFTRASMTSRVDEFNWDDYIGHSVQRMRDGIALLDQIAEAISKTASLPLPATASSIDRRLQQLEDGLYHPVFRVLIAAVLTVLTIGPGIHLLVLLPSAAFQSIARPDFLWIWTAARIGIVAAAIVFAGMLGVAAVRCLVSRRLAPMWVTIRRAALLILQPLILLLTIPVSARFGSGLITGIAGAIPMMVMGGVLNLILSPLSGKFNFMLVSIAVSAAMLAAAGVLGALHIGVRRMWVDGPLKVILDIVRYMGSPTYRTTLQKAFDDRISALETDPSGHRRVMLLAHSLGSVIALDSLVNSSAWTATDTVFLVTMGSPIRRSFIRFFPGYLFPPSVDEAARVVASRVGHFSWINVHRRWDYVGTELGFTRDAIGQDLNTGQITRIVRSHSDYWGDDVVVGTIRDGLQRAKPVVADREPATTAPAHTTPDLAESYDLGRVTALARVVAVMVVVGMVSVAAASFVRAYRSWTNDIKTELGDVAQSGTKTVADVTYHRTLEAGGEDSYYLHHFVFKIAGQPAPLPPIEIQDRTVDTRFDYRALAAFVLEQCGRAEEKRWWQILKSVREIPCTRTSIPLVYDARKPQSIWLPQFPPRARRWDTVGSTVGLLILGLFFALGSTFLVVGGGMRLFRLFLGMSAVAAPRPTVMQPVA